MNLRDIVNPKYQDPRAFSSVYSNNKPFPHIVFDNFVNESFLCEVLEEFPDLSKSNSKFEFANSREVKFASKGFEDISPRAVDLISYLNSDLFLSYLQTLTGIEEVLLSDPYLTGGVTMKLKTVAF